MNRRRGFIVLGMLLGFLTLIITGLVIAKSIADPSRIPAVIISLTIFPIAILMRRVKAIYWKQLRSLLLHKWYVFLAGRLTRVPLWRLIIHDWSKFMPIEFPRYARYKYGNGTKEEWAIGWLHHMHHEGHHSEHWIILWHGDPVFYSGIGGEDITKYVSILPMPETYVREMIADMLATSKQVTGSWDIANWLNQNGPEMHLHDETIALINQVLYEIGYNLTDNCDWSWVAGRNLFMRKKWFD